MGEYFLIAFLILFAASGLLGIPEWVVLACALAAGILKLVGR